DAAVVLAGDDALAVGRKGDGTRARMAGERAGLVPLDGVPENDGAVETARGDQLAVGAEADRGDRLRMSAQSVHRRQGLAVAPPGQVPQADRVVVAARGEQGPVRTEAHRADRSGVAAAPRQDFVTALDVVGAEEQVRRRAA